MTAFGSVGGLRGFEGLWRGRRSGGRLAGPGRLLRRPGLFDGVGPLLGLLPPGR
ncbi:hypothetical protein ACFQHO_29605 [Actinomadura yumaensis]|uniref:hypothetical protein n=1 Tax=Actinomadura TaxID=1988 RepID=UPI0013690441|nr:hypothetical protein [Actinomadura sp. J1-007]